MKEAYGEDTSLIDCMRFHNEDEKQNWGMLTQDFVVERNNKRIKYFVETVHEAKIEAERKLRAELDQKILLMRSERLI